MAITLVQSKSGIVSSTTSLTITLTGSTTAGNCLVVAVSLGNQNGSTQTVSGITLGGAAGNFAALATAASGTSNCATIWADPNCSGGQTSVVITCTGSAWIGAEVYEFSGLATSSVLDKSSTGTATSSSWSSGTTATTTSAAEAWVGVVSYTTSNTLTGPGAPWTANTNINTSGKFGGAGLTGYQITSSTGTATYSGTDAGSDTYGAVVVTLKPAAGAAVSGTVQPLPTDPVPRRKRKRAVVGFTPVTTTNPSGPTGTIQPETAAPAPRRKPTRAVIRFTPVPGGTFTAGVAGKAQPATAVPAPRRKPARAWLKFTPVTTTNATGTSGRVQPEATVPIPRRKRLRAIAAGIAVPGVRSTAPVQEYQTPPRRKRLRAVVNFTPVPGGNAGRQLLIALASQAGTDDYGNTFPEGIYATAGVIEGPEIIAFGAGGLYLAYSPTPAVNNLISSVAGASGTDSFGNAFLAGTTSYTFDGTEYTALNMQGGVLTWYQAATEAGPWVQQSAITFQGSDVSSSATVNINSGATRLVGSASAVIPTFNPGITSLPHDNNSGSTWVSGERAFMNSNWVDTVNSNFSTIITILRNVGIIG